MKLSLSHSVEQKLSTKLEQRNEISLDLRQQLSQKLGLESERFQSELVGPPDKLLADVISSLIAETQNPQLREGLKQLYTDPVLLETMVMNNEDLAFADPKKIRRMVIEYVYNTHQGKFSYEVEGENGNLTEVAEITKEAWMGVNLKPTMMREEASALIERMKTAGTEDVTGTQARFREIQDGLNIAEMSKPHITTVSKSVEFLFSKKDSNGQSTLERFFKEYSIIRKMNVALSERIQKRFIANFSRLKGRTPEQMQTAFLNSVAEFALVGMGVISKDIFVVQKADIDPEVEEYLQRQADETGVDLKAAADHYGLQTSGTIFWSRWHTRQETPSRDMDNEIREFITVTLRKDASEILAAANYSQFFSEIRSGLRRERDKDGKATFLVAAITDKLMDETFRNKLMELMRDKWMPALIAKQ